MRDINLIVIHCSATKEGQDFDVDDIREWHMNGRNFKDIGYHFVIRLDGRIERGRPWDVPGAHAKGYNNNSIGICYVGGLNSKGEPADTRTTAQMHALRTAVSMLQAQYPMIGLTGHRDLSTDLNGDGVITANEWMKSCPCFDVKTEL